MFKDMLKKGRFKIKGKLVVGNFLIVFKELEKGESTTRHMYQ